MARGKVRVRTIVVGITPAIRHFYRELRRSGVDRDTADMMTTGAVLYSGEGRVGYLDIPGGVVPDARGRGAGVMTVGEKIRKAGP